MMSWTIYLFGSGLIFFIGIGLILGGVFLAWKKRPRWMVAGFALFVVIGLILVAMSATPLPNWLYGLAGGVTLAWMILESWSPEWHVRRSNVTRMGVVTAWIIALGLEAPYHFMPRFETTSRPRLMIIGDSVTAGMGEKDLARWPRLLAQTHDIEVLDFAQMGATVSSALKQSHRLPAGPGFVLLEIGGNDILGSTTVEKFEQGLVALLDRVCAEERTVIMFELPLPPFQNDYGRVQRDLAKRCDVTLIPKRVFVAVLTADEGTVDSIHLAPAGHERMAEVVGGLFRR